MLDSRSAARPCIWDKRKTAFFLLLLTGGSLASSQEYRSTVTITGKQQSFNVDLSKLPATDAATITIRNLSNQTIKFPQVSSAEVWPYHIDSIRRQLPSDTSDQELIIATWKYVIDHTFHYCSAGSTTSRGKVFEIDPVVLINSYGFGCCDQTDRVLAWIWQQLGYKARLGSMYAHTVPEVYYGGSWHMLDPDHRSYYLRDDGTIASLADILADPQIVVRQSTNGRDGIGWDANKMAQLYADNAHTLSYVESGYLQDRGLDVSLRPNEQLTIHSENLAGTSLFDDSGDPFTFKNVGSGAFRWDLTYADKDWKSWSSDSRNIQVTSDKDGRRYLVATATNGSITYHNSSIFPVMSLSLSAQASVLGKGSIVASVSLDGKTWSPAVPLAITADVSSYGYFATLADQIAGAHSYFVKLQISSGVQLERLRIEPIVQVSKFLVPKLNAGSLNTLHYSDDSPEEQPRKLTITVVIPNGLPRVRGLHAVSRVHESSTYSLARGYVAANLVDNNSDTLAYTGRPQIDYEVDLNGFRRVSSVAIDWGYFGSDSRYISQWSLLGSVGADNWVTLASGEFPGTQTTHIKLNSTATALRLLASGSNNIGVYDLRVFGTELPNLPGSQARATSPTQLVQAGFTPASNLVDGRSSTLASSGSRTLDYRITLPQSSILSGAVIYWGNFGQDPSGISSWSLSGRNSPLAPWTVLGQGGFPNHATSGLLLNSEASELRLVANSTQKVIGAYELTLYGAPVQVLSQPLGSRTTSNQIESSGVNTFADASQAADGNDATFAYPGSRSPDYTLDLLGEMNVSAVRINWGYFGTDPEYVQDWRLYGMRTASNTWDLIARGGFPDSVMTSVSVENRYRRLRIAADSANNFIGIFEVEPFGTPAAARSAPLDLRLRYRPRPIGLKALR